MLSGLKNLSRSTSSLLFAVLLVVGAVHAQEPPKGMDLPLVQDSPVADDQHFFNGSWLPSVDPFLIGPDNFKELQNMRYVASPVGTSIEGIEGYSTVNTTPITSEPDVRNGFQLRTGYDTESYVLVVTDDSVWQNTTSIPSQGSFESLSIFAQSASADTGMFSEFPSGSVGFANSEASCVWSGNEVKIGALFTITELAGSYSDCTISATDNSIICPAGTDFMSDGYRPGQFVTIDGTGSNESDITVYTITATTITPVETLTAEWPVNLTLTVGRPGKDIIDQTDAANNSLTTTDNVVTLGDEVPGDVVLLLHFDGTEGSTTITDSSGNAPATYTVTASLDTDVKKFGTASLLCTAYSESVWYTDSANWFMDSGDFTIEYWLRIDDLDAVGNGVMCSQYVDADNNVMFSYSNTTGKINGIYVSGGVTQWELEATFSPVEARWYHVAFARDGTELNLYVDGVLVMQEIVSGSAWPDLAAVFEINGANTGSLSGLTAHYDEFRVIKGRAAFTSEFSPKGRAYRDGQEQFLVMTTRPLQGVNFYIEEPNTITSTMSGSYWTGNVFSTLSLTDGTSSGGISLAQSGTVSFSSTASDAKPFHFQGLCLYSYLFTLSGGSADVYKITADAPFQGIVDVWDGVDRVCTAFQIYDSTDDTYRDYTLEVNYPSTSTATYGAIISDAASGYSFVGGSDHIIAMFEERMSGIRFAIANSKSNTQTARPSISYYNGMGWVDVGNMIDGTIASSSNWATFGQTGLYTWDPPPRSEEATVLMFGRSGYAYSITTNNTINGDLSECVIDTVYGIPAQLEVPPFRFPSMYRDRAFLCNYKAGYESNRVDYSFPNTTEVWNGAETSSGGLQSLYFGGMDAILAGHQIYNRFGSSIYTMWIALKRNQTYVLSGTGPDDYRIYSVSDNVGCPAPLTLAMAEVGYQVGQDIAKNIMIWLSFSGPVVFDGSVIFPIRGIENYFDPSRSECVNTGIIDVSRGWYDQTHDEYNLLIPSGSGSTAVNTWLVYSMRHLKWYEKAPFSEYPISGWPVRDSDGTQYIYMGTDDGRVFRDGVSTMWNTSPINYMWETGEYRPSNNIWDVTNIQRFKIFGVKGTEDANLSITHFADTASSGGTSFSAWCMDSGSNRVSFDTQSINLTAVNHRFQFSVTMGTGGSAQEGFPKPLGWGVQYVLDRKDQ